MAELNEKLARVETGYDPGDPLFRGPNLARWANSAYYAPALPIVFYFASRLRDAIRALPARPDIFEQTPAGLTDALLARLETRISRQIHRAVILDINGDRLLGLLEGETPTERFRNFNEQMRTPARRARFFADYPALFDTLYLALSDWQEASEEFLARLREDYAALQTTFGLIGTFTAFADNSGDSHNRGRSVMVLEFSSGTRLVYKPHSIDVDAQFQNFLAWMSEQGLPTERLRLLARKGHGWVEFVTNGPCANEAEVEVFYERSGQLLAALYLLGGTDVHSENLIARGPQPIVVDVETLFHPHVIDNTRAEASDDARSLLQKEIGSSVLKTDFLPRLKGDPARAADQSGIGGRAGQATAIKGRGVVAMGTDEVRVAETTYTTGPVKNRPRLAGKEMPVNGAALLRGFEHGYRIFLENRDGLRALLDGFRDLTIRAVPRNSEAYFQLLMASYHPDALALAGAREKVVATLAQNSPARYRALLMSEEAQLLAGDIPYFHTTPVSYDYHGGDGTLIPGIIRESGWDILEGKLAKLGEADLTLQTTLIRASLASLSALTPATLPSRKPGPGAAYLDQARAVGDELGRTAFRFRGGATWVSLQSKGRHVLANANVYGLEQVGTGLYDGLSGIGFFLHYLTEATGEEKYAHLLTEVVMSLGKTPTLPSPSAFGGVGSLVYFFAHHAPARVPALLPLMDPAKGAAGNPDVVSGASGALLALLAAGALPKAEEFGALLADHIEEERPWPVLRGFSHGLAGAGLALARLAEATLGSEKRDRFRRAARQAFAREDALLAGGQYTDPVYFEQSGAHQTTWCHGTPGLALARLKAAGPLREDSLLARAGELLAEPCGPAYNHGLCHGSLGNADILLEAAKHLPGGGTYAERARSAGAHEDFRAGWRTAFPLHYENPGLMTGLAGIGYGFLRLADPSLPCALSLDRPREKT